MAAPSPTPAGGRTPAGGAGPAGSDQLVVATPQLSLVSTALERMGARVSQVVESPALGLSLLTIDVAGELGADVVGGLLDRLRVESARDHAGWRPTVGRNRLLGHVTGVGEISYGGQGSPAPVDPPVTRPARGTGPGSGARVGVFDTALVPHPWLAGGWVGRWSDTAAPPVRAAGSPTDGEVGAVELAGHSTFVVGLVLTGAPGATVQVRRTLGADGTADSWSVATAIAGAGADGLDVVNLSLACTTADGRPPLALQTAVTRLGPGTVVVAAAGNHGDRPGPDGARPAWPAALDGVVAVGAAAADGSRAPFSPDQPWVDLLAPGVDSVSTYLDEVPTATGTLRFGGYARWSGTSFAAAVVSGAIAAGVQPGRVGARESWEDLRISLGTSGAGRVPVLVPR